MAASKQHAYHLVQLSPWPIVSSLSAFVIMVGLVLFMHEFTSIVLIMGILSILACSFGWFKDIIHEAEYEKEHTVIVQRGLRIGMVLFIVSEIMFFASFFWAYFNFSLFPNDIIGNIWPPKDIELISTFRLPFLNTLLLLLSGTTITWSHQALLENNRLGFKRGLWLTVALGFIFLSIQAFEYSHTTIAFRDNIYGSIFFMSTGFHGFHVLIGSIILLVCFLRAIKGHFTKNHHVGFEIGAWYWHFVDVVWLFLFVWIYWWGNS